MSFRSHKSTGTCSDQTASSPGFKVFSPVAIDSVDDNMNWVDPRLNLDLGLWDANDSAHLLDSRKSIAGTQGFTSYLQESFDGSMAPSISLPSVTNRWYETHYKSQGERGERDTYVDIKEDGDEVEQPFYHHANNQLHSLSNRNFHHDTDEHGHRRSGVESENYATCDDPPSLVYSQCADASDVSNEHHGACTSHSQYTSTQDTLRPLGQASLSPPLQSSHPKAKKKKKSKKAVEERLELERRTQECLHDAGVMFAWEVYKYCMKSETSEPGLDDHLWKRFALYCNQTIVDYLNSGDLQRMNQAKMMLAEPDMYKPLYGYGKAQPETWSDWTRANYNEEEIQKLVLQCCQVCETEMNDQFACKYWRNKILTRSNGKNIKALKYGNLESQQWALNELAGKHFVEKQKRMVKMSNEPVADVDPHLNLTFTAIRRI